MLNILCAVLMMASATLFAAQPQGVPTGQDGVNGNRETAVVDGRALLTGAAPDVALDPNDVVFVPGRINAKSFLEHWPILIAK